MNDYSKWNKLYENSERLFDIPIILEAEVVHGFKRGSKELGIPTANLSMEQLGVKGSILDTGIYFGWTLLDNEIYQSVGSIGWNPFYNNEKKTIEVHLLTELDDFYGKTIKVILCGYLRQETNFNSLDDLISCIKSDISKTKAYLTESKASRFSDITTWDEITSVDDSKIVSKM